MTSPHSIQLHYSPGSCSLAAHILLTDTGIPFEAIPTSTKGGLPESYRKLNPKMRVPILVFDGTQTITETTAVLTAIAQLVPERHLTGTTPLDTVRVYEWMNWLSGTLHGQAWRGLLRPETFSDDVGAYDGIRAMGQRRCVECYRLVEEGLAKTGGGEKGPFALGEELTVVDFALYAYWRWGASREMVSETTHPRYTRLVMALGRRESVRKTVEVEGVEAYLPELTGNSSS